jgi:hypothetical protein
MKIIGTCLNWNYPYRMKWECESLGQLTSSVLNNKLEFSFIDNVQSTVIFCQFQKPRRFWMPPTFNLNIIKPVKSSWTLNKSGWLKMEVDGCTGKFTVSLRKINQHLTESIVLSMSRQDVSLDFSNISIKEFPGVAFYMGLSYFVWVRYSMMCES